MDKANIADKIGRGLETKVTAANCPAKGEHRNFLGRTHPPCGELIPGEWPRSDWERWLGTKQATSTPSGTSVEVAALWDQYKAADAERSRIEGEIVENGRELLVLRGEAYDAAFAPGNRSGFENAAALAKIERNRVRRRELVELKDAAIERVEQLIRERSKLEAREAAERRRLEASTQRTN